jgi:hypothetical protein
MAVKIVFMRAQARKCRAFYAQVVFNDDDAIENIANCLGLSSGFSRTAATTQADLPFNRIGSGKVGIEKPGG